VRRREPNAPARRAARRRGFTLLEVLASVAVLAIVYTVLAGSAMQGLANEGESYRRLKASLLADRQLAAIEASLAQGVPELGVTEGEEDEFTIAVETRPFDLAGLAAAAQETEGVRGARPTGGEAVGGGVPFQLLVPPRDGTPPPLVEIQIAVRWLEGNQEQMVTRTTFAYDQRVVAPLAGALAGDESAPGADDGRRSDDGSAAGGTPRGVLPPRSGETGE
jgi:prepilin-type N-terminal cleavage/methylation domain-containing protein